MEKKILIGSGCCIFCGEDNRIEVTAKELEGYDKWTRGEGNIQDVMPTLSAEKREVLISGTCLSCQSKIFGVGYDAGVKPEYVGYDAGIRPEYELSPEPIEHELNKLGYILEEEENGVVEFTNGDTHMSLLLDYNLMTARKVDRNKEDDHDNGHTEDLYHYEATVLRKYGFDINYEYETEDENFTSEDDIFEDYDDYDKECLDDEDKFDDDTFDIDDLPF